MSDYTQSYRKYLLILVLPLLYCELYKPSELAGLVKTDFDSTLNLGLYILRVVGDYKIYTGFVPWQIIPNFH